MKIFPTTNKPIWGQSASWQGVENWQTTLAFNADRPVVQEVVPAYLSLHAELHLQGEDGDYTLVFPGGTHSFTVQGGDLRQNVSALLTTGKHLYEIRTQHSFQASLTVRAKRPLVEATDESYCIEWRMLSEGERQQMLGDRPAHRVGLWSRWIKVLPADSRETLIGQTSITLQSAQFHPPLSVYPADFSGVGLDDTSWSQVDLPHTWQDEQTEGFAWYRVRFNTLDAWRGQQVVIRLENVDVEMLVYINGHTVGYYQPQGRPLQFEIGQYLRWSAKNVLTLRVSQSVGHTFHVNPVMITPVVRYGVTFAGRLYPADEDALQLSLHKGDGHSVGFEEDSQLRYRPPEIRCLNLSSGEERVTICGLAVEDSPALLFDIAPSDDTPLWLKLRIDPKALGFEQIRIDAEDVHTLKLTDANQERTLWLYLPGMQRWIAPEGQVLNQTFELMIQFAGKTCLIIGWELPASKAYVTALDRWQEAVYQVARPLKMDDVQAAAWRSYKQTVLLNARNVTDDVAHGLLAAFDKPVFHVYWMRDCAISVPGAIYTGGDAQRTAFENVGPTMDRYAQVPECIGLYPDGTPREGGFSDSPALGVWAQGYAYALKGRDWLQAHYTATTQQLDYLLARDAADGDPLDGIIRSSQGDWKDVGSMRRLWRVGAVFFVNVVYLRALRVAAEMATALGHEEDALRWSDLREQGLAMLQMDIADGGLWLPEHGYYADWVQVEGEKSWAYPLDLDKVTVFTAFSTTAHGIALAEGLVPPERVPQVVDAIQRLNLINPFPAPAKYPFYDTLRETGHDVPVTETIALSNPWQLKELFPDLPSWLTYDMVLPWKGWPGNHVWGGRWMMSGAWLTLGLWRAGYTDMARQAQQNLARALLRARHPGRCEETESYSAVSREETGSHVDPAGYYQLWSGAVPLQALVEGAYGILPTHDGVKVDFQHYSVGDGIERVPIRGGVVSCKRETATDYVIQLDTDTAGKLHVKLNPGQVLRVSGGEQVSDQQDGDFVVQYKPHSKGHILVQNKEYGDG